jgi:hypothetical protein
MKLFQIEEPDGSPTDPDGPGAAVGIDVAASGGAVAVAVGGNPEILPDSDGERRVAAPGLLGADRHFASAALADLLRRLRGQAEKQLARPVTHAVIAAEPFDRAAVDAAAAAAGLTILRVVERRHAAERAQGAARDEAAVLGAAIEAEELAPPAA